MSMPREVGHNMISGGRGPGNRKRRRDITRNSELREQEHPSHDRMTLRHPEVGLDICAPRFSEGGGATQTAERRATRSTLNYKSTLTVELGTLTVTIRLFDRSTAILPPEDVLLGCGPTTPRPISADRNVTNSWSPDGTV